MAEMGVQQGATHTSLVLCVICSATGKEKKMTIHQHSFQKMLAWLLSDPLGELKKAASFAHGLNDKEVSLVLLLS